jgi:hypothetical protein
MIRIATSLPMGTDVTVQEPPSLDFEVKGGSPLVLHVKLGEEVYEVRVVPVVMEVGHAEGLKNDADPSMPVFALKANLQVHTKRIS